MLYSTEDVPYYIRDTTGWQIIIGIEEELKEAVDSNVKFQQYMRHLKRLIE